jgi:hypothetical protein
VVVVVVVVVVWHGGIQKLEAIVAPLGDFRLKEGG